eukprot:4860493-Prymnesium_polylepis.1
MLIWIDTRVARALELVDQAGVTIELPLHRGALDLSRARALFSVGRLQVGGLHELVLLTPEAAV